MAEIRGWLRERVIPGRVALTYYDGTPSTTFDHYWRWPITLHFRRSWRRAVSAHGVQEGWRDPDSGPHESGCRERGFMSIFWLGPVGVFIGAHRPFLDRRRLGPRTSWQRPR